MLAYPQLLTGGAGQFPIRKRRSLRTVTNTTADGHIYKLADTAAELTEWQLEYRDLTTSEANSLEDFFRIAEGSLTGFTFLDPADNLLAWSERFDEAVWQRGPLLQLAGGCPDPESGNRAWQITNSGAGAQSLIQTLQAPADYTYCLSAFVRSEQPGMVSLIAGAATVSKQAGNTWQRIMLTGSGTTGADSVTFGFEVPAGGSVEIFGAQVEPQRYPSGYKPSTRGGVYPHARLRDDVLAITYTDVNRHSCKVNILHATSV